MRAAIVIALVAAPMVAHAEDEIARGSVVKIEAQEIYVSIGRDKGVAAGAALRIKRPVSLHNPVTRALVEDWIPIAGASVTDAGAQMSRAVVGTTVTEIQVGDVAEVLVDRPEPTAPTLEQQNVDPATAEVLGIFTQQVGRPVDERIAAWEHYLSIRGSSPYAAGVRRDLDELHALRDQLQPPKSPRQGVVANVDHNAMKVAAAGEAIPLVFVLDHADRVASAYLHYRPRGAKTYRSELLVREHDIYLRGIVPAEVVSAPGVDYFVEVSSPAGRSGLALGSPQVPIEVDVAEPPLLERFAPVPGRSSVQLTFDYLDFGNLDHRSGDRTDRQEHATVDFTYRLKGFVESVGVGYGVYAGQGGYADMTWDAMNPQPETAFHYGYADVEVGGHDSDGIHYSVGGQLIAGVGREGFGMGGEGRLRIGEREATNLQLIARTIDRVGFLSEVKLGTRPADRMLVGVSVGATNQPNEGDVGVKLGTEVQLLASESVSLLVRGSWQGRSINHGGLGAGAGVGFRW
jgi:hypothetical protein